LLTNHHVLVQAHGLAELLTPLLLLLSPLLLLVVVVVAVVVFLLPWLGGANSFCDMLA
jgi:hypothetical protein